MKEIIGKTLLFLGIILLFAVPTAILAVMVESFTFIVPLSILSFICGIAFGKKFMD